MGMGIFSKAIVHKLRLFGGSWRCVHEKFELGSCQHCLWPSLGKSRLEVVALENRWNGWLLRELLWPRLFCLLILLAFLDLVVGRIINQAWLLETSRLRGLVKQSKILRYFSYVGCLPLISRSLDTPCRPLSGSWHRPIQYSAALSGALEDRGLRYLGVQKSARRLQLHLELSQEVQRLDQPWPGSSHPTDIPR